MLVRQLVVLFNLDCIVLFFSSVFCFQSLQFFKINRFCKLTKLFQVFVHQNTFFLHWPVVFSRYVCYKISSFLYVCECYYCYTTLFRVEILTEKRRKICSFTIAQSVKYLKTQGVRILSKTCLFRRKQEQNYQGLHRRLRRV